MYFKPPFSFFTLKTCIIEESILKIIHLFNGLIINEMFDL